jgi:P-type E1-E2 ATPase
MVDYSCALKLTGSIAALAAMRQSAREGFVVKGSKHFEAMARADTIVFDKTGTLTNATPRVAAVLALDGYTEEQVLRLAACLEEHFPHPVARAVVAAAVERKLEHRERHTEVEYVVAHGIASSIEGKRCVIGSEHFVVEDEGVALDEKTRERIARELNGFSPLYLAVGGELVGVIGVTDPLKPGVRAVIDELRGLGFEHVVMLTGDGERAAARAAAEAGIAEYRSAMLPEHKYAYVEDLKAQGRHVVMVGDGVNDSPALSLADVGIAMESGTAVAREVADITLASGDLALIARLRRLSLELDRRMDRQFREVMGFNSLLLVLGIGGVITPQLSSLLHNGSTVLFSAESTRSYDDAVGCASAGDGAA